MPHPREAIFDVLFSKMQRKLDNLKKSKAWEEYERQNKLANAVYRGKEK